MTTPILLDTCAALWVTTETVQLGARAVDAMVEADKAGAPVLISPITAWEVGQLVARGRYALSRHPQQWFNGLLEAGLVLAPLTPEILIGSSFLPSSSLRDPADRILAATARLHGYKLMTRDKPLLDYAAAGHMHAVAC